MKERRINWWPVHRRRGRLTKEAGAALFQGLRVRLTLWYCLVLGAALILFSVTLYISARFLLLNPIMTNAQQHAQSHLQQAMSGDPNIANSACLTAGYGLQGRFGPGPDQAFNNELVACYDANGNLEPIDIQYEQSQLPSAFLSNNLAELALQTGQPQSDIVDAGGSTGPIYRYTELVPGPPGSGFQVVIVIGESVKDAENTLGLLLTLLFSVGGAALIGAGIGGLFLANRALAPARLAWSNQQRFIGDAAHELRTPLTLLRADAEVLLRSRKRMDPDDAMILEDIVAESNHMSSIATNLLTLARLDSKAQHQEHEVINLAEMAQQGARRITSLADEKGITVQAETSGEPLVIGDPVLLEQAMIVLLDNAVKYNREGGRIIVRAFEQDDRAVLEVSDTGIGISAEHLPHLGERFYRVDKARTREAGGTGLGLSIARSIAAAHDGELMLTSVAGQGTTVTVKLPLAQVIHSDLAMEEV